MYTKWGEEGCLCCILQDFKIDIFLTSLRPFFEADYDNVVVGLSCYTPGLLPNIDPSLRGKGVRKHGWCKG